MKKSEVSNEVGNSNPNHGSGKPEQGEVSLSLKCFNTGKIGVPTNIFAEVVNKLPANLLSEMHVMLDVHALTENGVALTPTMIANSFACVPLNTPVCCEGVKNAEDIASMADVFTHINMLPPMRSIGMEVTNELRQIYSAANISADMTLAQGVERFIERNRSHWKDGTASKYLSDFDTHILPALGNCLLYGFGNGQVNAFYQVLVEKGLSSKSVREVMGLLKRCLYNLMPGIERHLTFPKVKVVTNKTEVLKERDVALLICGLVNKLDRINLGLLIMIFTGMRVGEVTALACKDIDLDAGVIHVNATACTAPTWKDVGPRTERRRDTPKTEASRRSIPIVKDLQDLIKEHHCQDKEALLLSESDRIISANTMSRRLKKVAREMGCENQNPHLHQLRHTFATFIITHEGTDIKTASELLGHSDIHTTAEIYLHSSDAEKRKAAENFFRHLLNIADELDLDDFDPDDPNDPDDPDNPDNPDNPDDPDGSVGPVGPVGPVAPVRPRSPKGPDFCGMAGVKVRR